MVNIFYYCKLIVKSLFYFLNRKEFIALLKFVIVLFTVLLVSCINSLFLMLDYIFYDFNKIEIKKPLFIVGFPRSGTTFLHKSIAIDSQFTTPQLWELLFAPSIIQKKIWLKLYKIVNIKTNLVQIPLLGKVIKRFDNIHKIRLSYPEEDYLFFIPSGACFLLIIIMPISEIWSLNNFDENFSTNFKKRLMKKYKKMIKRHLYTFGKEKIYLSKNPYFTPFVKTLNDNFKNATIIGCHRDPKESIPSLLSNMQEAYLLMSRDITNNKHVYKYIKMYKIFYDIMKEQEHRNNNFMLYHMNDISQNLVSIISKIYKQYDYILKDEFIHKIVQISKKSKSFVSKHAYNLSDYNVDPNYIDRVFSNNK